MRIAYLDCISGISGDMTLGALIDLGVAPERIEAGIQSLGLGQLRLEVETVKKCGFRATYVQVQHPPEHAHRHLHTIEQMIDQADAVTDTAKELAKRIFRRLGEAEAKVHGTTIEKVHFHEVGAVDSIADIVGTAIGLDDLQLDAVHASPVPTGCGTIEIAHGRVSIPAPATAELLKQVPLAASEIPHELTTPTGAAILAALANQFGSLPAMTVERIGYGAGTRDLEGQANVLRMLVGNLAAVPSPFPVEVDSVVVIEANIDSASGEDLAECVRRLWDRGAIDVFQTACQMKKGRMGTLVTVLSAPSRMVDLEEVLFTFGGTIGVRYRRMDRHKLVRRSQAVDTALGTLRGKCVWMPAGNWRFSLEHDDAAAAAAQHGVSLDQIRQLAEAAFAQATPLDPPATIGGRQPPDSSSDDRSD